MDEALALAQTGLGHVWPNPTVGCLIVRGGQAIGQGRTAPGGRPHAEVLALRAAGEGARGATAYVTLEPCAHWGRTPPCTNALIEAGVSRVVVALVDPDPRTNGRGIRRMRAQGIAVDVGLGQARAAEINEGFFLRVRTGRPLIGLTDARGPALAALAVTWDAVAAHPAAAAAVTPRGVTVSIDGVSEASAASLWLAEADQRAPGGAEHVVLPSRRHQQGRLATALAALGERGLTRLLVHADDPLAAALSQAGLVDCEDPS